MYDISFLMYGKSKQEETITFPDWSEKDIICMMLG